MTCSVEEGSLHHTIFLSTAHIFHENVIINSAFAEIKNESIFPHQHINVLCH
jgi:hypothetical protein